jgi:hypothetical protein
LEDLLRECTVRVIGPKSGTGFFVAPGKVLTCFHVISDGGLPPDPAGGISVVWERDGQPAVTFAVTEEPEVLPSRGRPVEMLDADYPDIAVLEVDVPADHPCVWLDTGWPSDDRRLQAYGYPKEGGSVRLASAKLEYRGMHGTSPEMYLDLKSDTVKPGMSGAAVLNWATGGVCGILVATRNAQRPDGALAVPLSEIKADLGSLLAGNRAFHDQDLTWAETALKEPGTRHAGSPAPLITGLTAKHASQRRTIPKALAPASPEKSAAIRGERNRAQVARSHLASAPEQSCVRRTNEGPTKVVGPKELDPQPAKSHIPNYDELSIAQVRARLRSLNADQLKELIRYERDHASRKDFIAMLEHRIAKL